MSKRRKRPCQEENSDADEWEERAPEHAEHHRRNKRKRCEKNYTQDGSDRILAKMSPEQTEQRGSRKRKQADKNRDEPEFTSRSLKERKQYKDKKNKHGRHEKIKRKKGGNS